MLPILIAQNAPIKDILLLISIKIVIGFISGFIIDLLIKKEKLKNTLIYVKTSTVIVVMVS